MIRVNEEIRKELSYILSNGLKDPRVDTLLTVVRVETTSDLKHCKVFISSLKSKEEKQETIKGLKNAEGFIKRELARRINLRNTPQLNFVLDDSIEYSINMTNMLNRIHVEEDEDGNEDE